MFGTMGFSELIIILVIILIIFGAGRLPQIGEGVGKALKGFKKEVTDIPPPVDPNEGQPSEVANLPPGGEPGTATTPSSQEPGASNQPFEPGPEQTPGTTAALLYQGAGPQVVQPKGQPGVSSSPSPSVGAAVPPPVSMEERQAQPVATASGQYPPLPPGAQPKPVTKRPSAIVNKKAVARVQAQQAALKAQGAQASSGMAPENMQSLGEGLGSAVRTFKDAAADIKNSIDPQMRSIQAELEAAEKEMQETIEVAKQPGSSKDTSG